LPPQPSAITASTPARATQQREAREGETMEHEA
jgi:hypothetical protein